MIGIALALCAALTYGLSVVLVRRRLDESSVLNAILALSLVGNLILWPIVLIFTDLTTINLEAVILFAIAGTLAPGIGRLFYYKGVERLGVAVNSSVLATYPLYSSVLAVSLLGETLFPIDWIGIICVVVGAISVERSSGKRGTNKRRHQGRDLIFPMVAAFVVALSHLFRKYGLEMCDEPIFGVAIGYSFSFFLYLMVQALSGKRKSCPLSANDIRMFWKAGVGLSLGWIFAFYALSYEKVSIVATLIQTEPVFVVFFAYIYLKRLENLSRKLILSTIIIVLGVILIGM